LRELLHNGGELADELGHRNILMVHLEVLLGLLPACHGGKGHIRIKHRKRMLERAVWESGRGYTFLDQKTEVWGETRIDYTNVLSDDGGLLDRVLSEATQKMRKHDFTVLVIVFFWCQAYVIYEWRRKLLLSSYDDTVGG